jgi:hypothetical protein
VTAPPVEAFLQAPVRAVVQMYGTPRSVRSSDDGQHFTFVDGAARFDTIVDDDGHVHAVDLSCQSGTSFAVRLDDDHTHPLVFGTTTSLEARDALATVAETEGANYRVFRRDASTDVVLIFADPGQTLSDVVVGDRATLLRLGYVRPAIPAGPVFPFVAPVLRHSALDDGNGARATILRIEVDRLGIVRDAVVFVESGDAAFDRRAVQAVSDDTYAPATLSGRPIGATVFREVRH